MLYIFFIPLAVGTISVLQNTLNKRVADTMGLSLALVVNNIVLLSLSLSLFLFLKLVPESDLPSLFRSKGEIQFLHIRNFWPGLFGFLIIAALPLAIEKAGALKVFLGVIVAQIAMSLIWDYFVESIPVNLPRIVGAAITLVGAVIATRG